VVCLDTSFLIDLMHANKKVVALKDEFDRYNEQLSVAAPSVMELWSGVILSKFSAIEKNRIEEFLESLDMLPLDLNAAKDAASIEAFLISRGMPIGETDTMIAAIARVNNEKLVTGDEHFVRIPSLTVIKY
jgi:tRNA(fMet)-specific endonuclease VapC